MGMFFGGYRTNIVLSNLAAGTNDLWTVPAGYRATILGNSIVGSTASVTTVIFASKISGSYYKLAASGTSVTTNASTAIQFGASTGQFMWEAGESFAMTTASAGLNGWITIGVWPDTVPFKCIKLLTVDNTVQTLYTCPTNKVAYCGDATTTANLGFNASARVTVGNTSGSARTYSVWHVPNGGSASVLNAAVQNFNVNDNGVGQSSGIPFLLPGEFVQIQSSSATATQFCWMTVIELDHP